MGKELLGVFVELVGDVLVVAGYTGQRLATLEPANDLSLVSIGSSSIIPDEDEVEVRFCTRLRLYMCGNPAWVGAFLVFALGQALELVALGLASESTVVAIGNLSLVFNAMASVYVFGEDFSLFPKHGGLYLFYQWDGFNLVLLILGSALTVAFAPLSTPKEESKFNAEELRKMWTESPFIYFNIVMIISMCFLGYKSYQNFNNKNEGKAPLFLASSLGILSAFSVTLSKVVTELLGKTFEGENQFNDAGAIFMTITWVAGLVAQLIILNIGLRNFEQGVFVPMFETLSASITIIFGCMYFKSYKDFHGEIGKVVGFCVGVITLIIGLFLSSRRHQPSREEMVARLQQHSPRIQHRRSFNSEPLLPVTRSQSLESYTRLEAD